MSTNSNCDNELSKNNLSEGDIIKFGNYFINNDQIKEPIEWRVLKVSNSKALLITKDAIDDKVYSMDCVDNITWEQCSLRQWLNNEFLNQAFTKDEQDKIRLTTIRYRTKGGNSTQDKIFLLSIHEAKKYFKDDKDRECKRTNYAKLEFSLPYEIEYEEKYVENCYWWLRGLGAYRKSLAGVDRRGEIGGELDEGRFDDLGAVRPAMYINL